ncbi:hypothetical protein [Paenibacillus antibioticophila]|uniref:hypothetical protein n=1 Tax=Paenibacillus antibioticophila TaxID=1274374 RepID=UPI0005C89166|nr:hypothetical protein [Paenibacillus antibioticophila]
MLQQIFDYFKTQPGWSLVITVVFTALVWLYKEFKVMMEADQKSKLVILQKKMDLYSSVEAAAAQVINRQDDPLAIHHLYTRLGESGAYFTEDIRKVIRDYYERADISILRTLMAFIKAETSKLEKERNKLLVTETSSDVFDAVARLFRPLKPILVLFMTILIAIGFLFNFFQADKYIDRVIWLIAFISTSFSLCLLMVIISLWIEQSLRIKGGYSWFLTIVIIICPVLSILEIKLAVLSLVVQLISFIQFIKNKKNDLIVT